MTVTTLDMPAPVALASPDPIAPSYALRGGTPLRGEVEIRGAKNAALPIIAATLLTDDACRIENVPDIADIHTMLEVLEHLGARVAFDRAAGALTIQADHIRSRTTPADLATRMRASFLVMGPLLARFGQASTFQPGGCAIGARPLDVHSQGFRHLGAQVAVVDDRFSASGELRGASFVLDYPSHTGTENILMAAVLAEGETVIDNASIEPEVLDLVAFLRAMGARIAWPGATKVAIQGVPRLHGTAYRLMPDRIEAGTYLLAGAVTGGDVTVTRTAPEHLRAVLAKLDEAGVRVDVADHAIRVTTPRPLAAVDVRTYPYPGFPTDLQQPFTALLTQAEGESVVHETIFEGRLNYASELVKLGADIRVVGQSAHVRGRTNLRGAHVDALNLRAGAAVALAGLAAEGESIVANVQHIERGYTAFAETLRDLGADIAVVAEPSAS